MKTLEMLEKSLSEQESRQNEDRMKYGEKCREQPTIKSLRRGSVLPTMQAPVLSAVATHAHWLLAPQETKAPHLEAAHLATTGATGVLHWPALQV